MRRPAAVAASLLLTLTWTTSLARADTRPTPNQLVITEVAVDTAALELSIAGHEFCTNPIVELAGTQIPSVGSSSLIIADLPPAIAAGDFLLTVDCRRGANGFDAWELTIGSAGPAGPAGPPGPPGPAGPAGVLGFYVVTGDTETIASSATDVDIVNCDPGDSAVSWSSEGFGIVAGPGVSGFTNVVPVVTGSVPTGFTFTFVCATTPTCELTHRIICADMTP